MGDFLYSGLEEVLGGDSAVDASEGGVVLITAGNGTR
jgi:hypothetical protein